MLVLGLGNDLLSDDAIGLRVVQELRRRVQSTPHLAFAETTEMGLALLDLVIGFDSLVIIDAIQTGKAAPGWVHELGLEDLRGLPGMSPHFLGIPELLALGPKLGLAVPTQVKLFAVEVQDPFTVSTEITPALEGAFPRIVEQVLAHCRP